MKTSPMYHTCSRLRAATLLVATLASASLHAADYNWTGDGSNRNWATEANWDSAPRFTTSNNFIFSTGKGTTSANPSFIGDSRSVNSLVFATSSDIGIRLSTSGSSSANRLLMVKDGVRVNAGANGNYTIGVDAVGTFRLHSEADTVRFDHNGNGLLTIGTKIDEAAAGKSVEKTGSGTLVFSGANTYTGDTVVSAGTLNLASTSELRFVIASDNQSNRVSGSGTVNFDGMLLLDTSAFTGASGSWNLIDVSSLNASFNASSFGLAFVDGPAFSSVSGGVYTSGDWTFNTATGNLTLGTIPEPATSALLVGGGLFAVLLAHRRLRK